MLYLTIKYLLLFTFSACTHPPQNENTPMTDTIKDLTEIVYRFGDSSVPPPYHRSYTIKLTRDSVSKVVDSYGTIISETTLKSSEATFISVISLIEELEIKNCELDENDGCTGGTTEYLSLFKGGQKVFFGSVYHCGSNDYGNLCGDISSLATQLNALIPSASVISNDEE